MDGRDETELERWDRNFNELLQELRVAQTGEQILFAFLLTVARTLAKLGLLFLGLAIVGTVFLALDEVAGGAVAVAGTLAVAVLYTALWYGLPMVNRRRV